MSINIFRFCPHLGHAIQVTGELLAQDETRLFVREPGQPGTRVYPLAPGTLVLPAELPLSISPDWRIYDTPPGITLTVPAAWSREHAAREIRTRNLNPHFTGWPAIARKGPHYRREPLFTGVHADLHL